ncbi:diguanylate cyclase domain-containing protein [Microbacterium keratanolyticum]|uniref:diguanylate cyclase domain-containing protein n=1 Tax=Microbacterium keratanolyticum TaxID=67574 RepID=UPI0036250126
MTDDRTQVGLSHDLLDAAPVAILTMELRGTILAHNAPTARWLGDDEGLIGSNLVDLLTPASRLLYETQVVPRLVETGHVRALTLEVRTRSGEKRPMLVNANLRQRDTPTPVVHIAAFDATARVEFEQELVQTRREAAVAHRALSLLQEATSRLALAGGSDDLGEILADSAGTALQARWTEVRLQENTGGDAVGAATLRRWGQAPPSVGVAPDEAFSSDTLICRDLTEIAAEKPQRAAALTKDGVEALLVVPIMRERQDGRTVLGDIRCWFGRPRTLGSEEVETLHALAAQAERVLDHLRLQDRLRHIALHDALTGLPNRMLFQDRLAETLAHSGTREEPCAVLFIDLDGFKQINDARGHGVGDEVLRTVSTRLRNACRQSDVVARLGGDEFLILLEDMTLEDARCLAERVRAAVRMPLDGPASGMPLSASVGVLGWNPRDGVRAPSAAEFIAAADALMYEVKRDGKDGVLARGWSA